jgi:hypothetical protein
MTMNMGAVASLRRVKNAISVARNVLEHTRHSLLVGDLATQFALSVGFKEETLETNKSHSMWQHWMENNCQPNFWVVCNMIWIRINCIIGTNTMKYSNNLQYVSLGTRTTSYSITNIKTGHKAQLVKSLSPSRSLLS